jgi:hypothetical protein
MSSKLAASTYGLAFSISPARKQSKNKNNNNNEDDEEYVLTLAPFTRPPKINFGTVKINEIVDRNLLILNPQQFQVELNVSSNELNINNIHLVLEKNQNINLNIKWQPDRADYYKYSILFEVTNSARLKFVVHAYGVCVKPEPKKSSMITRRAPFTMLQPLKKEKSTEFDALLNSKTGLNSCANKTILVNKENKPKNTNLTITKSTTFMVKKKVQNYDDIKMYNTFYKNELEKQDTSTIIHDDELEILEIPSRLNDRRKTCVIRTPKFKSVECLISVVEKFNKNTQYFDYEEEEEEVFAMNSTKFSTYASANTPIRRTSSVNDIENSTSRFTASFYESAIWDKTIKIENKNPTSDENSTPKLSDFVRTNNTTTLIKTIENDLSSNCSNYQTPTLAFHTATTSRINQTIIINKKESSFNQEAKLLQYTVLCQKWWRMKQFRRHVQKIKKEIEEKKLEKLERENQLLILKYTLKCQRAYRMKRFRRNLQIYRDFLNKFKAEKEHQEKMLKYTIMIQKAYRYKKFKTNLNRLVTEKKAAEELKIYKENLLISTVICQKLYRYKRFKHSLVKLKLERRKELEYQEKLLRTVILCQRVFRYKKFKSNLIRLRKEKQEREHLMNRSATIIQKQWRLHRFRSSIDKYRKSAELIQSWYRSCLKQRFYYLNLRKQTIKIQQQYKLKFKKLVECAVRIQSIWRMYVFREQFIIQKEATIKIQQWFRSKADRLRFLKLKRSLPIVQQKSKELIKKKNDSARKIQMAFKIYNFRKVMTKYRNSAVLIQQWIRSDRYR